MAARSDADKPNNHDFFNGNRFSRIQPPDNILQRCASFSAFIILHLPCPVNTMFPNKFEFFSVNVQGISVCCLRNRNFYIVLCKFCAVLPRPADIRIHAVKRSDVVRCGFDLLPIRLLVSIFFFPSNAGRPLSIAVTISEKAGSAALTESESCDKLTSIPRLFATVPLDLSVRLSPSVVSELPDNGGLLSILVLFFLLDLTSPVSAAFSFAPIWLASVCSVVGTLCGCFATSESAFVISSTAFCPAAMSSENSFSPSEIPLFFPVSFPSARLIARRIPLAVLPQFVLCTNVVQRTEP